ncbi:MAG TPA: response regulator, partial [Coleofasciculaceae cyanobacterium]
MKIDDRPVVLLIDDSTEDRVTYRRFLERDPQFAYEILEASSAEAALEMCQQRVPDVLLLD